MLGLDETIKRLRRRGEHVTINPTRFGTERGVLTEVRFSRRDRLFGPLHLIGVMYVDFAGIVQRDKVAEIAVHTSALCEIWQSETTQKFIQQTHAMVLDIFTAAQLSEQARTLLQRLSQHFPAQCRDFSQAVERLYVLGRRLRVYLGAIRGEARRVRELGQLDLNAAVNILAGLQLVWNHQKHLRVNVQIYRNSLIELGHLIPATPPASLPSQQSTQFRRLRGQADTLLARVEVLDRLGRESDPEARAERLYQQRLRMLRTPADLPVAN